MSRSLVCLIIVGCLASSAPAEAPLGLASAASLLEHGDDAAALPVLARYVTRHPDHLIVRAYLAELYWRAGEVPNAVAQFERFVADAQQQPAEHPCRDHLIHCHTRLMSLAADRADAYGEHLNRGIGLLLLAGRMTAEEAESLLFQAVGELTLAHREQPEQARPGLYLADAWDALSQTRSARRWRERAMTAAPFSDLTPAERRRLALTAGLVESRRR